MASQELTKYITEQLKTGLGFEDIKKLLLEAGWDEKSIDGAYGEAGAAPSVNTQEREYVLADFRSPPSYKRAVKRFVILCVGGGAAILFLYVFTR